MSSNNYCWSEVELCKQLLKHESEGPGFNRGGKAGANALSTLPKAEAEA